MTNEEIIQEIMETCTLHHSALRSGYWTTKCRGFERYEGRFGKGWIIKMNHPRSTRYHIIEYWIER